jgi:vitamin B12 transporter
MKGLQTSFIALLALLPLPVMAQTITDLDDIVVTANRAPTAQNRAGAVVTRLGRTQLDAQPGQGAVQLLSKVPGVSIRTNGPIGTQAGLTVRGIPQTNIGVRVDGIDITDPSGTQVAYDFGTMTTMDLSAVELVRGAQSALYGSRTVGGAFEFLTRRAETDGVSQEVQAEAGSYQTAKLSYSLSIKQGAREFSATLSRLQTEGFSAADDANGNDEADGYEANRFSFFARTETEGGVGLSLNGFVEASDSEYDEGFGTNVFDGTPDEQIDRETYGLRAAADFSIGAVTHRIETSRFNIDRVLSGTNSYGPFRFHYSGTRDVLSYSGEAKLGAITTLTFGAGRAWEGYFDDLEFSSQNAETRITDLHAELALVPSDNLDIVISARTDEHSRFGSFNTGRLSVNWRLTPETILRANLGNGFRAPSNYELFDANAGNSALQPEKSVSFDLGVEQAFGDAGKVSMTYFDVTTRDLVDYSYSTYTYIQVPGQARRQGVEIAGELTLAPGFVANAAYTYTDATMTAELDSSAWSAVTPRHSLALGIGTDVGANGHLSVDTLAAFGRKNLPDYGVLNASFIYDLGDMREVYLRTENLTDAQYQTVQGYGTPGRSVYVGLRAKF